MPLLRSAERYGARLAGNGYRSSGVQTPQRSILVRRELVGCGAMHRRAIVPDHHIAVLPAVAELEPLLGAMLVEGIQQGIAFVLGHALDSDYAGGEAGKNIDGFDAGFGM